MNVRAGTAGRALLAGAVIETKKENEKRCEMGTATGKLVTRGGGAYSRG